ncbi:MAG: FAD-binding oxidoreductase, partial [Dongiaceae bacterium]
MMDQRDAASLGYGALAEQVRRCESTRQPLCIRGGETLFAAESAAGGAEICDATLYRSLIAHAHEDMTVTVQAGMTIGELQAILATRNQHLPLDVPAPERTTVGGLIAANLSGPRRFSCGTVRDLLIGLAVVGRGGELIRGGGRVVKNVAGYDLCKLFTGSWGWLGVIVEATFRVSAIPQAAGGVAFGDDTPAEAEAAIAAIPAGELRPASLD